MNGALSFKTNIFGVVYCTSCYKEFVIDIGFTFANIFIPIN